MKTLVTHLEPNGCQPLCAVEKAEQHGASDWKPHCGMQSAMSATPRWPYLSRWRARSGFGSAIRCWRVGGCSCWALEPH